MGSRGEVRGGGIGGRNQMGKQKSSTGHDKHTK